MKFVTFACRPHGSPRLGALQADAVTIVDLPAAASAANMPAEHFADMLTFLDGGTAAGDAAQRVLDFATTQRPPGALLPLGDVTLLAPLPCPRSIRDCMAFEQHLIQSMRTVVGWKFPPLAWLDRGLARVFGRGFLRPARVWYERPLYYKGNPHSVVGPGADVHWPPFTRRLDYELEFGIVIGKPGRDIPVAGARQHIAGYTIFNDFSARDLQLREMTGRLGPAKSKDFDTGNALGPCLVTPDEVPDPYSLTMIARVNGDEWSRGNSRDMHYSFEEIIATISESETLLPGDFIGSGTVPGGCGLELGRWIKPGDVIELEVERLGALRNQVVGGPRT
jgi:2-keto-4-pentenoate hydratase/2-oxohepta-3-ene-1,7-dioic acid hydratase in catechol pathway